MITEIPTHGRWIAERDLNGHWIAVRYAPSRVPGRGLERERDGRWHRGELLPSYHMTLEQCEARCVELNGPKGAN
jgi:hypothetical protein